MKVIECCRRLALFTEEPGRTTRRFLTPPMRDVHRVLGERMERLGMRVWVDAAGNLRGQLGSARRLIIASHLDTVPDAGAFDGPLGVVMGIALAEEWKSEKLGIEVVGFSEEEGVRFGTPFIGSRAFAGTLGRPQPEVAEAIREFGLDPAELPQARCGEGAIGYLEFHIEQGPVLEGIGLPLGVVDAIAGQSRLQFKFQGKANHAGTTPMNFRQDALACAAEWILEVERESGTVGKIEVEPNATNVVPGKVQASLDVRSVDREKRVARLIASAQQIASRRGLTVTWEQSLDQPTVPLDAALTAQLEKAVETARYPVHRMSSGAGHDAMILAPHLPTAMLFLRSPGGVSHSPLETVLEQDVEAGLAVGMELLRQLEKADDSSTMDPAHA